MEESFTYTVLTVICVVVVQREGLHSKPKMASITRILPAGPDCPLNRSYLRRLRHSLITRSPPPDFSARNRSALILLSCKKSCLQTTLSTILRSRCNPNCEFSGFIQGGRLQRKGRARRSFPCGPCHDGLASKVGSYYNQNLSFISRAFEPKPILANKQSFVIILRRRTTTYPPSRLVVRLRRLVRRLCWCGRRQRLPLRGSISQLSGPQSVM